MKPCSLLSLLLAGLLLCGTGSATAASPAKGLFVSCRGCRLNSLPEVRRFFYDSVLAGEYGDKLDVQFKPGASPRLVLLSDTDEEISSSDIAHLSFDGLHELVQGHGFQKVATSSSSSNEEPSKEQQPTETAPAPASPADSATEEATAADTTPAKAVFVSCKACRLKRLPQVRRFLYDSVAAGEYGDNVQVNFKNGAIPTLVLYNAAGEEISRTDVTHYKLDELHELVQGHGFQITERKTATDDVTPVRGVFESCKSCKLKRLPQVRRFFYDSVLAGEYGDKLSVKFFPSAVPELVLYNAADELISRTEVTKLSFDELHQLVQGHGFQVTQRKTATEDLKPVRGVFESCKSCKLRRLPQVRRFFYDSVLAGEYGDKLDVKFISGAVPELVLYNAADELISRSDVTKFTFDGLHELVQGHGFQKVASTTSSSNEETNSSSSSSSSDGEATSQEPHQPTVHAAGAAAGVKGIEEL